MTYSVYVGKDWQLAAAVLAPESARKSEARKLLELARRNAVDIAIKMHGFVWDGAKIIFDACNK